MTDEDDVVTRRLAEDEIEKAIARGEDFSLEEIAQRAAKRTPPGILRRMSLEMIGQAVVALKRTGGKISEHDLIAAGMGEWQADMLMKDPEFFLRLEAFMVERGELPSRKPS